MHGMRVLVTGAAGYLGRATVGHLAADPGVELVIALDRVDPAVDDRATVLGIRRDVCEPLESLLRDHRIDTVVHGAYLIRPPRDVAVARRINVEATAALVSAARSAGVQKIVYPSSTTVYGAWPDSGLHTEDEEPRPLPGFTYSEHKVEAERILLDAATDMVVIVLRGCVVVGPGADNFILSSLGLPILPYPAGADPDLQFLHVHDYTAAVATALQAPDSGLYNIAGGGTVRLRDLARTLGTRALPIPAPMLRFVIDATWRLRLQSRSPANGLALIRYPWLASTARIEQALGWRPDRSSLEAIGDWAGKRRVPPGRSEA
jgi:UDP-glucose 4-epimerase